MIEKYNESDMYEPIKNFFQKLGYSVKGEVKNCDIVITKDDELIIIELKKSFNISLLYQAINRQKITKNVYAAIPRPKRANDKHFKYNRQIAEKLELGLITVAMDSPVQTVEIICFPKNDKEAKQSRLKEQILKEAAGRNFDNNGGSNKIKLKTVYRENCIKLACIFKKYGPMSVKELVNLYGAPKNTYSILYANNYGWFQKIDKGIYDITMEGVESLKEKSFAQLVEYYEERV